MVGRLPGTVEQDERSFAQRGAMLTVDVLGEHAYADVAHPRLGQFGTYAVRVSADTAAAEAAARWQRQTTRNR